MKKRIVLVVAIVAGVGILAALLWRGYVHIRFYQTPDSVLAQYGSEKQRFKDSLGVDLRLCKNRDNGTPVYKLGRSAWPQSVSYYYNEEGMEIDRTSFGDSLTAESIERATPSVKVHDCTVIDDTFPRLYRRTKDNLREFLLFSDAIPTL